MNACMMAYTFYENDTRVMRYAEALVKRGDTVDAIVLRADGKPRFEVMNGVNVYRIQKRVVNEKGKFAYLSRLMRFFVKSAFFIAGRQLRKKYDVVHVHSVPDFEVFAAGLRNTQENHALRALHNAHLGVDSECLGASAGITDRVCPDDSEERDCQHREAVDARMAGVEERDASEKSSVGDAVQRGVVERSEDRDLTRLTGNDSVECVSDCRQADDEAGGMHVPEGECNSTKNGGERTYCSKRIGRDP